MIWKKEHHFEGGVPLLYTKTYKKYEKTVDKL